MICVYIVFDEFGYLWFVDWLTFFEFIVYCYFCVTYLLFIGIVYLLLIALLVSVLFGGFRLFVLLFVGFVFEFCDFVFVFLLDLGFDWIYIVIVV